MGRDRVRCARLASGGKVIRNSLELTQVMISHFTVATGVCWYVREDVEEMWPSHSLARSSRDAESVKQIGRPRPKTHGPMEPDLISRTRDWTPSRGTSLRVSSSLFPCRSGSSSQLTFSLVRPKAKQPAHHWSNQAVQ